jgi:hypothetical protein
MVVPRDYRCQAARRSTRGFVSMNTSILTLGRLTVRVETLRRIALSLFSTSYAQSVDNGVEKGHTMLGRH